MDFLTNISELAKRILGVQSVQPVNLSKVDKQLSTVKNRTSQPIATPVKPLDPIEVLPEYEFVLEAIKNGECAIFVTGKAGTGKSTMIRFLSEKIQNCAVIAPTAIAAINVSGSTIHSFFNIPPRVVNPDEVFQPKQKMLPVIENLGALIIDEISMVPPNLVDCINNILKKTRRNDLPFGGMPVIFVGDLLQLPPVVNDFEVAKFYTSRYRSPYFFSADCFSEIKIIPIELTRVFRQSSQDFVSLLDKIRLNDNHRDAVARLNRECYRDKVPSTHPSLFLVPTNAAAKSINEKQIRAINSESRQYDARVEGRFNVDKDRFQAPYSLELKENAQIIFVKNRKPFWLNGTLGRVVSLEQDIIRVEIIGSGNIVTVTRDRWDKIDYVYDHLQGRITSRVVGSFIQFPLTLGWAITIHKSQGMTLDSVRIDLGNGAFCTGQTYVALSRCKTQDGISLDRPIAMSDVKADQTILNFYAGINPLRNQKNDRLNSN